MLAQSDTAVAVISAVPVVGEADPLSIDAMERGKALAAELCGDGRVLIQGHAVPDVGPLDAALASMAEVAAGHDLCAWKVYTHAPTGWALDDEAIGAPFLQAVRDTGVGVVAVHKGLSGGNRWASPADIGPAAAANPDLRFLVYHSGYESGVTEREFDPAGGGVDRLVRSVGEAGVGVGGNVYAELGSTWRTVMGSPDEAAHVLGKLLIGARSGAHPVGHRLDLVRLAPGPDRGLPGLPDLARVPGALRLPGPDAGGEGPHPGRQRGRAVRHHAASWHVRPGRRRGCARPTARTAPAPVATSSTCSGASTPGRSTARGESGAGAAPVRT